MKKRLAFLFASILFLLFILFVFERKSEEDNGQDMVEKHYISDLEFQSKDYITLLRTKTGKIENLNLNYYMLCVVASEMPFKFEFEALKSQAIVARTYLYNKIINNGEELADVCDSYAHCQAFVDIEDLERIWKEEKGYTDEEIIDGEEKIKRAILDTDCQVITYDGKIIDALFHSSSYLKTENAYALWSHKDIPYLKSVESVEEDYTNSKSCEYLYYDSFKDTLLANGYNKEISKEEFINMAIYSYTDSGRVNNIIVGPYIIDAQDLRAMFGIKSTNFTLENVEDYIVVDVKGFGHGVGMSQVGANTLAKQGFSYIDIIQHYYTGVEITKDKGVEYEN